MATTHRNKILTATVSNDTEDEALKYLQVRELVYNVDKKLIGVVLLDDNNVKYINYYVAEMSADLEVMLNVLDSLSGQDLRDLIYSLSSDALLTLLLQLDDVQETSLLTKISGSDFKYLCDKLDSDQLMVMIDRLTADELYNLMKQWATGDQKEIIGRLTDSDLQDFLYRLYNIQT